MTDNPLANVELGVIATPKAPSGFAEGVLARFASTEAAIAVARRQRARRMWLASGAVAAAIAAALVLVVVWPRGRATGSVIADAPRELSIGDLRVELAAKSSVQWQRDGKTLRVEQHGTATWHVPAGEKLHVDVAGAAAIDATDATLRVEVQMHADKKTLGTTAAMISVVTVAVIAGKAVLAGGGKEMTVETGTSAAVTPGQAPVEMITAQLPARPVSVMIVFQSDDSWLTEGRLASVEAAIDRLALPAGSQIGAVSYSTGATLELGFTPVGDRRGGSLGTLDHYARRIGSDLVQGMAMGAAELEKAKTPRRVLLVVGDGTQTNTDHSAKMVFMELIAPAQQQGIEVVPIVVRSEASAVPNFLDAVGVEEINANGKDLTEVMLGAVGVPPSPQAVMVVFAGRAGWTTKDLLPLRAIGTGLEHLGLAPGSTVSAVQYSTGADIRISWERAEDVKADQIGSVADYKNRTGSDLVQGLVLGLAELSKQKQPVKTLVVIGDGNDTNNEAAENALREIALQAGKLNVRIRAIHLRSGDSPVGSLLPELDSAPIEVMHPGGTAEALVLAVH